MLVALTLYLPVALCCMCRKLWTGFLPYEQLSSNLSRVDSRRSLMQRYEVHVSMPVSVCLWNELDYTFLCPPNAASSFSHMGACNSRISIQDASKYEGFVTNT